MKTLTIPACRLAFLAGLLLILVLAGCTTPPAAPTAVPTAAPTNPPAEPSPPPSATPTQAAPTDASPPTSDTPAASNTPAASATPAASPTPGATATPGPTSTLDPNVTIVPSPTVTPIQGVINADQLFLRDGPSTLYAVQAMYLKDGRVSVIGRVPGNEWLQVVAAGSKEGWMAAQFIDLPMPVEEVPELTVVYSIVISGTVRTSGGDPLAGMNMTVVASGDASLRADAATLEDGIYYLYVPPNSAGFWTVAIAGSTCDSQVVDKDCQLKDYVLLTNEQRIQLPPQGPIDFVYEKTSLTLSGQVQGDAAAGLRVFAQREDGATTWGQTDSSGKFVLPVLPGVWKVYAFNTATGKAGKSVTITVASGQPASDVSLAAP